MAPTTAYSSTNVTEKRDDQFLNQGGSGDFPPKLRIASGYEDEGPQRDFKARLEVNGKLLIFRVNLTGFQWAAQDLNVPYAWGVDIKLDGFDENDGPALKSKIKEIICSTKTDFAELDITNDPKRIFNKKSIYVISRGSAYESVNDCVGSVASFFQMVEKPEAETRSKEPSPFTSLGDKCITLAKSLFPELEQVPKAAIGFSQVIYAQMDPGGRLLCAFGRPADLSVIPAKYPEFFVDQVINLLSGKIGEQTVIQDEVRYNTFRSGLTFHFEESWQQIAPHFRYRLGSNPPALAVPKDLALSMPPARIEHEHIVLGSVFEQNIVPDLLNKWLPSISGLTGLLSLDNPSVISSNATKALKAKLEEFKSKNIPDEERLANLKADAFGTLIRSVLESFSSNNLEISSDGYLQLVEATKRFIETQTTNLLLCVIP